MKFARPKAVNVWHEGDPIKMEVVNKNGRKEDRNVYNNGNDTSERIMSL